MADLTQKALRSRSCRFSVNEFEENIIWRGADLLDLSSRQRVALGLAIVADMEASAQRVATAAPRARIASSKAIPAVGH
jgi:MOSC domain-containing protein YiiM